MVHYSTYLYDNLNPLRNFGHEAYGQTDGHTLTILCSVCDASAKKAVVIG